MTTQLTQEQIWKEARLNLEARLEECGRSVTRRNEELNAENEDRRHRAVNDPRACDERVEVGVNRMTDDECRQILRAIAHGDAGNYGMCGQCGGAIVPGRLKVLPYTTQCAACAHGYAVGSDTEDAQAGAFA